MLGVPTSEFSNPLRMPRSKGIRVIDALRDIVLPELASSILAANGLVRQEYLDGVAPLGERFFTDREADFVRNQTTGAFLRACHRPAQRALRKGGR